MKTTEPTPKLPTKKALDAHVEKAMKATTARMRVNSERIIAKALHDAWAVDEKALATEVKVLNCQALGNKQ